MLLGLFLLLGTAVAVTEPYFPEECRGETVCPETFRTIVEKCYQEAEPLSSKICLQVCKYPQFIHTCLACTDGVGTPSYNAFHKFVYTRLCPSMADGFDDDHNATRAAGASGAALTAQPHLCVSLVAALAVAVAAAMAL